MKLQLKCDGCGKIGTDDEISEDYTGSDLCSTCTQAAKLADLKQRHAKKKEWLESTHLKELRELEKQIADIERELPNDLLSGGAVPAPADTTDEPAPSR